MSNSQRNTFHDTLGNEALALACSVREDDPEHLLGTLTAACTRDPQRMAQIVMALAAFVDIDEPHLRLVRRVAAITATKSTPVLQAVPA